MSERDRILAERKAQVLRQKTGKAPAQGSPFNTHRRNEQGAEDLLAPPEDDLDHEDEFLNDRFDEPEDDLVATELFGEAEEDHLELSAQFRQQMRVGKAQLQLQAEGMLSSEYYLRGKAMADFAHQMMMNLQERGFDRREIVAMLARWGQGQLF